MSAFFYIPYRQRAERKDSGGQIRQCAVKGIAGVVDGVFYADAAHGKALINAVVQNIGLVLGHGHGIERALPPGDLRIGDQLFCSLRPDMQELSNFLQGETEV